MTGASPRNAAETRYDSVEYRRTGPSGPGLPAAARGLWHNSGDNRTSESRWAILRRAFDLGVTVSRGLR